jgi:hypothetical protein
MERSPENQGKKAMATKTRKRRKARSAKQRANDKRLGAMARARHRGVTTKVRAKRRKRRAHKRAARAVIVSPHARLAVPVAVAVAVRVGARSIALSMSVAGARAVAIAARVALAASILANPALTMKRGLADYFSGFTKVGAHMQRGDGNGMEGLRGGWRWHGRYRVRRVRFWPASSCRLRSRWRRACSGTPMGARALSFGMYYTGGWAIAKFTPGLSQKTRDAIMFGALAASVLEIVKPGIIALGVSKIPVLVRWSPVTWRASNRSFPITLRRRSTEWERLASPKMSMTEAVDSTAIIRVGKCSPASAFRTSRVTTWPALAITPTLTVSGAMIWRGSVARPMMVPLAVDYSGA